MRGHRRQGMRGESYSASARTSATRTGMMQVSSMRRQEAGTESLRSMVTGSEVQSMEVRPRSSVLIASLKHVWS